MNRASVDYGHLFADMLSVNIRGFVTSGQRRHRNPGAPFVLGENHLRAHVRHALETRTYDPPQEGAHLVVERQVDDDLVMPYRRHGGVDYSFYPGEPPCRPHLRDVLATCEVSGPTRRKLLEGSRENWYPKIVVDIRKQLWRANFAPTGEHYIGLLIQLLDIPQFSPGTFDEICAGDLFQRRIEYADLNVIVMRVLPRHPD